MLVFSCTYFTFSLLKHSRSDQLEGHTPVALMRPGVDPLWQAPLGSTASACLFSDKTTAQVWADGDYASVIPGFLLPPSFDF